MSETFYTVIAAALLCILLVVSYFDNKDNRNYNMHIAERALMQTALIGQYSERTAISIKYWIYSIEVEVYKTHPKLNLIDVFRNWNATYNKDPEGYIRTGIEDAHTLFLSKLDEARENKCEPVFKVSSEYDYHVTPLSFKYNDYIDESSLLSMVDAQLGGGECV